MQRTIIAVCALALAAPAAALEASEENRSYIDSHKQLSELHTKAAQCLETKSVEECRAEIGRDCPSGVDCSTIFESVEGSSMRDAVREGSKTESGGPAPSSSEPSGKTEEDGSGQHDLNP